MSSEPSRKRPRAPSAAAPLPPAASVVSAAVSTTTTTAAVRAPAWQTERCCRAQCAGTAVLFCAGCDLAGYCAEACRDADGRAHASYCAATHGAAVDVPGSDGDDSDGQRSPLGQHVGAELRRTGVARRAALRTLGRAGLRELAVDGVVRLSATRALAHALLGPAVVTGLGLAPTPLGPLAALGCREFSDLVHDALCARVLAADNGAGGFTIAGVSMRFGDGLERRVVLDVALPPGGDHVVAALALVSDTW